MIVILFLLCSGKIWNSWWGCSLSYNVKLEANIEAKKFVLSVEEGMASGSVIIVRTAALTLFVIWWVVFQNSNDLICFFSNMIWTLHA